MRSMLTTLVKNIYIYIKKHAWDETPIKTLVQVQKSKKLQLLLTIFESL